MDPNQVEEEDLTTVLCKVIVDELNDNFEQRCMPILRQLQTQRRRRQQQSGQKTSKKRRRLEETSHNNSTQSPQLPTAPPAPVNTNEANLTRPENGLDPNQTGTQNGSNNSLSLPQSLPSRVTTTIEADHQSGAETGSNPNQSGVRENMSDPNQTGVKNGSESDKAMKLLFVEMGVGYDRDGKDATAAGMKACQNAISSNSIRAFKRDSVPSLTFEQMKLHVKLGVPPSLQKSVNIERIKSVFPCVKVLNVEVVNGGLLICSTDVQVEEVGDKNDNCYIVNAAVYVGY